jgi:hypothetical protein
MNTTTSISPLRRRMIEDMTVRGFRREDLRLVRQPQKLPVILTTDESLAAPAGRARGAAHAVAEARQPGVASQGTGAGGDCGCLGGLRRHLNNPLLVPTFSSTIEALSAGFASGEIPERWRTR